MTCKDYVLITAALKEARWSSWPAVCNELADALARKNPRFDRERFLKACGVQS